MRAIRLLGPGRIEVDEVPVPAIGRDEVLLKVGGAGLCASDLHMLHLPFALPEPLTLGHETAGWVAETGADVTGWTDGDPALVHLVWACGRCRPCQEGRDNVCATTGGRQGMPPCPGLGPAGGMADYIAVPARYLEPIGELPPARAASLADTGMTSMHAINGARHRLTPGATVAVIGLGGLGHVGLQILAATTDARLIAVDTEPDKLDYARRHGAAHAVVSDEHAAAAILALTDGYGADAVFDFVGVQATVNLATEVVAPDGALRFIGLGEGTFTYRAAGTTDWLPWGVDVRRSYAGTRGDLRQVVALAEAGDIVIQTESYPLEDAARAFSALESGKVVGRAVLVP